MPSSSTDVKSLQLQISASTELLRRNIAEADRTIAAFARDTGASLTRVESSFDGLGEKIGTVKDGIKGLLAGVGVGGVAGAVASFIEIADESKALQAQLRLATREFGDFNVAQTDVERIARTTRGGLSETVALYGSFVRASEQTGRTQAIASRATETFSKALKIGGADANAAASATLQFGQALASGALRGDEFNSIAEASPRILKLLADSMGLPQGQLRALAAEGKLTADILFKALTDTRFTAGIDAEFKEMPITFSEAMGQVKNAAVLTFGAFDRGGDFSTMLANFVTGGADGFASLEEKATQVGIDVRATFAGLADAFDPMDAGASSVIASIRSKFQGLRGEIANLLGAIDDANNFVRNHALIRADTINNTRLGGVRIGDAFGGALRLTEPSISDARGRFERASDRSELESRFRIARQDQADRNTAAANAARPAKLATPAPSAKKKTARKPKKAKVTPLADRIRAESDASLPSAGVQIGGFDILSDAATDVDALKASLDSLRTGLEGVDVGSILTPEEVDRIAMYSRELDRLGEDVLGSFIGLNDLTFDDLIGEFARLAIQMTVMEPLLARLRSGLSGLGGGAAGGGLVASALSIGARLFGGGRASGGPVSSSSVYMVGERGPEIFVPGTNGTIIPNHHIGGGGGGQTVQQSFDLRGAVVTEDLYRKMQGIGQASALAAIQLGGQMGSDDALRRLRTPSLPGSLG